MLTKTRKQGNSIMLTVPKQFDLPAGVEVEAKLVDNGILYEFVEPKDEFFDFSEDVLNDIISEGYEGEAILNEFKTRKQAGNKRLHAIGLETIASAELMTKEELARELGL